jgi:hypothetical protein
VLDPPFRAETVQRGMATLVVIPAFDTNRIAFFGLGTDSTMLTIG